MAHFAQLDENNTVVNVVVVRNEDMLDDSEEAGIAFLRGLFGETTEWKQTSYNGTLRVRYAGIGFTYDPAHDAFVPPKLNSDWEFDYETLDWIVPEDPQEQ